MGEKERDADLVPESKTRMSVQMPGHPTPSRHCGWMLPRWGRVHQSTVRGLRPDIVPKARVGADVTALGTWRCQPPVD